jgi:hypothetical protein
MRAFSFTASLAVLASACIRELPRCLAVLVDECESALGFSGSQRVPNPAALNFNELSFHAALRFRELGISTAWQCDHCATDARRRGTTSLLLCNEHRWDDNKIALVFSARRRNSK